MGFPLLRQLSTPAELFVINLISQHDPQTNAQLACCRNPGLAHSFLDELAPVEAFQFCVLDHGMQRGFDSQVTEQRIAFFGQLS